MLRRLRLHTALPLAALAALVTAGGASASPVDRLAGAKAGKPVQLAQGFVLTAPKAAVHRGGVYTVKGAKLRIAGTAAGTGVTAVGKPDGTVVLTGGRFALPKSLSRRRFTITGQLVLDAAGRSTGRFKTLKTARRAVSEDEAAAAVGSALPAAPAGQSWSLQLQLTEVGIDVGLYLGSERAGTVLIRWDGSYRVALTLRDLDLFGNKVTISGELTGGNIFDLTTINGLKGSIDGDLEISPGVHVLNGAVVWDKNGLLVSGKVAVDCPQGGRLNAGLNLRLVPGVDDWSVQVLGNTGGAKCGLADGLTLGPDTDARIELRSVGGEMSVQVKMRATLLTDLIPGRSEFTAGVTVDATPGGLVMKIVSETVGLSVDGKVNPNGTFALDFGISDLELFGAKVRGSGRVALDTPGGEPYVRISGGLGGELWLVPGVLALTGADLGYDSVTKTLTVAGTLKFVCTEGTMTLGASGALKDENNFMLEVAGTASRCSIGDRTVVLDGKTLQGKVGLSGGKLVIDFGILISEINAGDLNNPPAGGASMIGRNLQARISNQCAQCGDGNTLLIAFAGSVEVAAALPQFPNFRMGLTLKGSFVFSGDQVKSIGIGLTNISFFGIPTTLSVVIEGELIRTLEAALGLPPGSITLVPVDPTPVWIGGVGNPGGRVISVTPTLSLCKSGSRCRPTVSLAVRTTGRGSVALSLERKRCTRGRCSWTRVASSKLTPNSRYMVRAKTSAPLSGGTYRAVAKPNGRTGRTVTRTFRVL